MRERECVCVRVYEREREREKESVCVSFGGWGCTVRAGPYFVKNTGKISSFLLPLLTFLTVGFKGPGIIQA